MTSATPVYPKPKGLAVVIGLMSILLLFLGAQLTFSGGSPYFLVSGLTLAFCGLLLFRAIHEERRCMGYF